MHVIYYGSQRIIRKPNIDLLPVHEYFHNGLCFTEDVNIARRNALKSGKGYVNQYFIALEPIRILDLTLSRNIISWLAFILTSAEKKFDLRVPLAKTAMEYLTEVFKTDYTQYDLIRCFRFEDRVCIIVQDFISGGISYQELYNAIYKSLEVEVVVMPKALTYLRFLAAEGLDVNTYFVSDESIKELIDKQYDEMQLEDLFVLDILRHKKTADDF